MSAERTDAPAETQWARLGLAPKLLLFAALVLVGNALDGWMRYPEVGAAVLFPPYALLAAALTISVRREWLWYIAIGSAAHFVTHWPHWSVSWVVVADVANVSRALVAVVFLRRWFNGPPHLDSVGSLTRFVLAAVVIAPAAGATIGAANVTLHDGTTYWPPWKAWFLSNALTGLTLLPACLSAAGARAGKFRRVDRRRVTEAVALVVLFTLSGIVAFMVRGGSRWQLGILLYAPLPVLIWIALRFGTDAVSVALAAVTFAAIWGADRGTGVFVGSRPDDNILVLQLFVVLTALPVLCIAAVGGARDAVVRLHRSLLASQRDHVAILDAHGVVLEVNDSWRRFADALALSPCHRAHVADDYVALCSASADQGVASAARALAGVTRVLRRDAASFEMEYDDDSRALQARYRLTIEALERPAGGAVVTRSDVTAQHLARLEIEEQRRELSHLARVSALGQLSGSLAHELNQPLAAIANNAEAARLLLRRSTPDVAQIDSILRDIASQDQRAAQVIRRLRAMLTRGEMHLQPVGGAELVDEVLELARSELISRRVSASASIMPGLPPVMADRVQLQQVFLNLILNASEALLSTPVAARRVLLLVKPDIDGGVRFTVRDTGPGIQPELLDHVLEPFVTTKPDGLGLGLSISRTIVAAHGGRIWAENNPDRGASVHVVVASAGRSSATEALRPKIEPRPMATADAAPGGHR